MRKTLFLLILLALPVLAAAEPTVYKVDPDHSGVGFSIRHFVSNVPGRFNDFEGTIRYDPQSPSTSSVELSVRTTSIDTGNNDRDEHLRSADFFDAQKFPALTFTSTGVTLKDAHTLEVTGDLTLHGVTRQITIPVQTLGAVKTPNGEKAGFETLFTLNRKDFGITWNRVLDAGGTVLGEDVKITIEIEASRQTVVAPGPK
ncbi:MAG TPA: YceI family protein [Thermoanaerobaculia bacterium]|nr:YceI family protein [Thermoanaerobaculia bacterium]